MLRTWFAFAFTGALCVLSLPFFAISLLIAAICSAAVAFISPDRGCRKSIDSGIRENWAANEFQFERAIEAYEELIDTHSWRRP